MRWENMFVAAVGCWLGDPVPVESAVAAGRYSPARCKTLGYTSVLVAEDVAPPDMAVRAARSALDRAAIPAADYALVLHSSLWFQGLDIWPTASYVAGHSVGRSVPAFDVQQRCNAGLGAMDLAARYLSAGATAGTAAGAALLTTADRFASPGVDRWNMHDSNVYGDGGTAMVLSARGGFARVLSIATAADNSLEVLARGDMAFSPVSCAATTPVNLTERSRQHGAAGDPVKTYIRYAKVLRAARFRALADSGTRMEDLARVVLPATGQVDGDSQMPDLLGATAEQTTWEFGRTTGHIGAGDGCAGLAYLLASNGVAPGDRVMLFGGGAGYTCTAVVLEILRIPEWAGEPAGRAPALAAAD
jgi:3-oxoacyl-[acyl-carrier-protein] synthase-3